MAKLSIVAGATSQSVNVFVQDSSSTTGAGLAGLVFNTSSLIAYYTFTGANATSVQISLVTLATVTTAYSSGGFKEIDATNMKGLYRLDLPNAALATSKGRVVTVQLGGATNMAPCLLEIELTGWDNQDGVHGGMTAIPNVASGSAGALLIDGTGTAAISNSAGKVLLQATQSGVTIPTVTTVTNQLTAAQVATGVWQDTTAGDFTTASSIGKSLYTTGNAPGAASGLSLVGSNMGTVSSVTGAVASVTAAVTISAGTGAGQLDFTSGVVKANLAQILGTALTETAGQLAAAFKKFFNIATPASTMDHLTLLDTVTTATTATTATNLTNAPTAGDFTATMKTSLGTAVAASAVASVTGNVGGNVTGSVGSVVGAVGSVTGNVGGNVTGTVASVVDLSTTTLAEPSAVPAATATIKDKLNWLCTLGRNKLTQTATTTLLRNDSDAGTIGTSTVSDDGTTFTRGKFS